MNILNDLIEKYANECVLRAKIGVLGELLADMVEFAEQEKTGDAEKDQQISYFMGKLVEKIEDLLGNENEQPNEIKE